MYFIKRIFASKELRSALGTIDELDLIFSKSSIGGSGFEIIKKQLTTYVLRNEKELIEFNLNGQTPRVSVLFATAKMAKNQLMTGKYHIYRGVLNNLSEGPSFKYIYHKVIDFLVKAGRLSEEDAIYSRDQLNELIRDTG